MNMCGTAHEELPEGTSIHNDYGTVQDTVEKSQSNPRTKWQETHRNHSPELEEVPRPH